MQDAQDGGDQRTRGYIGAWTPVKGGDSDNGTDAQEVWMINEKGISR